MTSLEEFTAEAPGYVAAGAEWLDLNQPGWEGRIDLSKLNLRDGCRCVLGQVMPSGSFEVTLSHLFGSNWPEQGGIRWAAEHGFNLPEDFLFGTEYDVKALVYAVLDELWIALVKERHDTGTLSG